MRVRILTMLTAAVLSVVTVRPVSAQLPNAIGSPISLEAARRAVAPAVELARRSGWNMAVAIVDPAGDLVYFERMDGTQPASPAIAIEKARAAARFKRDTKWFQDVLAAGGEGLRVLKLEGAIPVDGGIPLVVDGKIVGAIGASGGTSTQDGQCARAGSDSLK